MSPPRDRRYSAEHVWLKPDGDHLIMGVTDHAQQSLGDINELELSSRGQRLGAGDCCGSIESVKTASDLIAPLAAIVLERNTAVDLDPELVNMQPYDGGWLLRPSDFEASDYDRSLEVGQYTDLIGD